MCKKRRNDRHERKEDVRKISVSCILLFLFSIIIFFVCHFTREFGNISVDWLNTLLLVIELLSQIGFSVFGVSFAIEYSSFRKIAAESAKDVADHILDASTKLDYMKNHNSKYYCRDLLYLSYMSHKSEISDDQKHILESQGQILQKLVKSIYIDKDIMDVVYCKRDDSIYKIATRKFTMINIYGLKEQFKTIFSYKAQKENEEFELEYFKVNGKKIDVATKNDEKLFDSTYDSSTALICDISEPKTTIEYKIQLRISCDDKSSIYNSRYLTRSFEHNIEIDKATGLKSCDVGIFSLLNSIGDDNEKGVCYVEDLVTTPNSIKKRISSSDWLFPSDGYILMFS